MGLILNKFRSLQKGRMENQLNLTCLQRDCIGGSDMDLYNTLEFC